MNQTDVSFPAAPTPLRVKRSKAHSPETALPEDHPMNAETRRRLEEDLETLRVQEQNLLAYESHLREWQERLDQAAQQHGTRFIATPVAPAGDGGLADGWAKLHRARALLEIEQRHMVDDRLALRDQEAQLKKREAALTTRERRLEEQEERQRAAHLVTKPAVSSRSPFAVAKSMLGLKAGRAG